jgi:hypothetical protein
MTRSTRLPRLFLACVLALTSVILASSVTPQEVSAHDNTTFCKWGFPWPRVPKFFVHLSGSFTVSEANAIQYGGESWYAANANLWFDRTYGTARDGEVYRGVTDDGNIAQTRTTTTDCNVDEGRPIVWAYTVYHNTERFYTDCLAVGQQWCVDNQYYDLHSVSTHEFGHWFLMTHSYSFGSSMTTFVGWGDVEPRDINSHDAQSAQIMYGSR